MVRSIIKLMAIGLKYVFVGISGLSANSVGALSLQRKLRKSSGRKGSFTYLFLPASLIAFHRADAG